MSKRKPPRGQALRDIRSGLSKLKAAGLYTGNVRSAKGGWRQKKLLKDFADVVSGKAQTVKVGKKNIREFDNSFKSRNGVLVVNTQKRGKVRYSEKRKELYYNIEEYGVKYKRIIPKSKITSPSELPKKPPKGKVWLYKIPHNFLRNYNSMIEFFEQYKNKRGFAEAIEIYEVKASEYPEDEE